MPKTSPGQMSIFDIDVPATKAKLTEANPDVENQMDQGYCPGHPWYYKLGGRVLGVDEIRPAEFHNFDPI